MTSKYYKFVSTVALRANIAASTAVTPNVNSTVVGNNAMIDGPEGCIGKFSV
jgi:hypothetical protein